MTRHPSRAPRHVVLLLLVSLLTSQLRSQYGVVAEDFPDGSPRIWYETRDSLPDGRWREWYPDGTLRYRAGWKAGKGHGLWEYFYPDGQLRSREVYEADLPIGVSRTYHPNGRLAQESVYVAGKLEGTQRSFSPTGEPTITARYRAGEKVIDRPERLAPGVISTGANEWGLSFTPSADTVFFTRRPVGDTQQKIYLSTRVDSGWTTPVVAPFSTAVDESPALSSDGQWIYFASLRPLPGGAATIGDDMNLWRVRRRQDGYGVPEPLSPFINKVRSVDDAWPTAYEAGPFLDRNGNLYYWTDGGAGRSADVFMAPTDGSGGFGEPRSLKGVNTMGSESAATLSPDGRYLIFSAYGREDGFGMEDLYVARRTATGFETPVNLGPLINDVGNEGCATFSPDGRYFYYCRDAGEGTPSDLYFIDTDYLPLPR